MKQERLLTIIRGPHISEKSSIISEDNNQVTFKVAIDATKPEIKEAVESLFDVEVKDVQVLNVKGKTKRTARGKIRRRSNWKKAYVRLEQGQEIDFAELA
ncbi:MAG: 50S ribosomal protein L23 [Gammaproteobacteria bacterium]|nr:50S ribosomal protein L23 [Gammaproteobacteria bacterium]MAY02393.1 50S ribosomal protein L23 [Gammaproteobacteria bacterium]|tara:strand:- start:192 stop:491 length:300 start_codon:yes stop_codon:yes gene_type:complete